jgi:uncharacterized damage-inducible protein DinB
MPEHFLPTDIAQILTRDLGTLAEEVNATPDELLWKAMPGITNSVGTLTYHLCGNLRHFIGGILGGSGYVRNREAEFSHQPLSKEQLLTEIESTITELNSALQKLTSEDLSREMPDTPPHHKGRSVGYFLIQLCCHFARHSGQLNYLRRIASAQ